MNHSESIGELAKALCVVQADATILGDNANGHNYRYVTLDKVVKVMLPKLAAQGLSVAQPLDSINGEPALTTIIMHNSGEWVSTTYPLAKAGMRQVNDAQQFGAAVTYARRYGLLSLLGVATGDDDDAACLTQKERPSGQKYGKDEPAPSEKILEGMYDCTSEQELADYMAKHKQTISTFPKAKQDEIVKAWGAYKELISMGGQPK